MANVVVKLKIMPEGLETDLKRLAEIIRHKIKAFGGHEIRYAEEPIAFGLRAIILTFLMDEQKGSTEPLEKELESMQEVKSAEVIDVRRAFG